MSLGTVDSQVILLPVLLYIINDEHIFMHVCIFLV